VIAHVEATGLGSNGCSKPTPTPTTSPPPLSAVPPWGKIAIGSHIREVQAVFSRVFNLPDMDNGGREFDHLFEDGEHFAIGTLDVRVIHTPGHTPACMTYVVGNDAFVGDTLFMPDYGSALRLSRW
jgi:glyoxylase-like metal-dependent hydrolase (beta-lactamase superfamily II)